jgi:hypothetical protein
MPMQTCGINGFLLLTPVENPLLANKHHHIEERPHIEDPSLFHPRISRLSHSLAHNFLQPTFPSRDVWQKYLTLNPEFL